MRLAEIEDEYGDAVEVVWKSFMLRPSPHLRSLQEHREYTRSWLTPAAQPESGSFTVWATDAEPPSHSIPALVAGKAAASFGEEAFRAFHVGIMAAYFEENRTISDPAVILAVVEKSGIPVEDFRERLERDRSTFEDEVFSEHAEAVGLGVTGIPSVVVDDALLIPGAVGTDIYRQVIKERRELREA